MNKLQQRFGFALVAAAILSLAAMVNPAAAFAEDNAALVADLGSPKRGTMQRAKVALLKQGQKAVPAVMTALDDTNTEKKAAAIQILGELKAREAVPRLIEELKSEDMMVQLMSAFSLGRIGDSRATPHLLGLLGGDNDIVQGTALYALGYLRDKAAIPKVKEFLANPDQDLRVAAATTLGMLDNQEGLEEALSGTASKNPTTIVASIQALGQIGDKRALRRLAEMVQDPSMAWKSEVQLSMRQIDYANAEQSGKIAFLASAVGDPASNVVEWAIGMLADLATPEAVALLEEKARTPNSREGAIALLKLRMLGK